MPFCDCCGERFREVWSYGRLRPLNYADDKPHSCPGSQVKASKKNNRGGNWRKKRKGTKGKASLWKARRWTGADKANRESDARLKFLLGAG